MISEQGGCLCGKLRYEARAQPVRVTLCHCTFCQRATGSTHMVEPIFQDADFQVTGTPQVYTFASSGSGHDVSIHFCAACGAKLYLSFARFPGVVGVYAGTFDNPSWFEQNAKNIWRLFLDSAQNGAIIPAGVPVYRQHRIANDGAPNEAIVFDAPHVVSR